MEHDGLFKNKVDIISKRRAAHGSGRRAWGFLIVVAIIAVLVAIAVPLFVGQVSEAEKATADANIRAVRGETTVYLLKNSKDTTTLWKEAEEGKIRGWIVDATVSNNGEITLTKVERRDVEATSTGVDYNYTTAGTYKKENGAYNINLFVKETDVEVKG